MPFIRHFFIGNKYYGHAEDHLRFVHGEAQEPWPYVICCPKCGEVWARTPVEGSSREWSMLRLYCEEHAGPDFRKVPGSLYLSWEPEFNETFPPEVIRREFELTLRLWEKENAARGQ